MDVEVFLGGTCPDLDTSGPGSRYCGIFFGRVRVGVMTPPQARRLYEELFVTGYGCREDMVLGGVPVTQFIIRVPGGELIRNHGRCPYCSSRDDCHAWRLGDETLWLPHTRFYQDGEERDSRWPWPHNWRMCEGSLTVWSQRDAASRRAQDKARKRGQGLLDSFGIST